MYVELLEVALRMEGVSGRGASVCRLFWWMPVGLELQSKCKPGVSRWLGEGLSENGVVRHEFECICHLKGDSGRYQASHFRSAMAV